MKKNNINIVASIVLGATFLVVWLQFIDWQEFLQYFHKFDLVAVLFFSIFYVFAYFLRSLRWKIILNPIYKMKILESFAIFMSGLLVNYLVPIRAGEVAKSIILKNRNNIKISQTLPTIFIDKITDLFPILLIILLLPLISIKLNFALHIVILLLFIIFLFFIWFLYFAIKHQQKALKFLHLFLKIIPFKYRIIFEVFFVNFVDGMAILNGRWRATILICLLTFLAVASEALYIFMVFKAFGAEISYLKILLGYTLMNLTYILPTPPAQIGSNQFMWALIFGFALGVNENLTGAAVTFSHLLTTIWIFGFGAISLFALKIRFGNLLKKRGIDEKY